MSDSSPLIPKGSLLEEQAQGRPHLRIAICIVAVHMVFLGGLLMQGCKREDPGALATPGFDPLVEFSTNEIATVVTVPSNDVPPQVTDYPPMLTEISDIPGMQPPAITEPLMEAEVAVPDPNLEVELPEVPAGEYTVVKGDSFYAIGRKLNVSPSDIARANPGVDSTRLQIGQKLQIPAGAGAGAGTGGSTAGNFATAEPGIYTVKQGDTLSRIARQYGTTVSELKRMNGLVIDRILINQKLKVPVPAGDTGPGN